jgi:hypothetical protein
MPNDDPEDTLKRLFTPVYEVGDYVETLDPDGGPAVANYDRGRIVALVGTDRAIVAWEDAAAQVEVALTAIGHADPEEPRPGIDAD